MARKPKTPPTPILPPSQLDALHAAGFEVLRYQNTAIEVQPHPGRTNRRREWLPEDAVNWDRRRFIKWATNDIYSFAGWEPQDGLHTFGGRYKTIHQALGWFHWLDEQRGQRA